MSGLIKNLKARVNQNDSRAEFSLFWRSVNRLGFGDLSQIPPVFRSVSGRHRGLLEFAPSRWLNRFLCGLWDRLAQDDAIRFGKHR
jgi:hypothetical protein